MAGWAAGNIAHAVLPLHLPTVCNLHFQPCTQEHNHMQKYVKHAKNPEKQRLKTMLIIAETNLTLNSHHIQLMTSLRTGPNWSCRLTSDLLGELDTLRICKGLGLLINVLDV